MIPLLLFHGALGGPADWDGFKAAEGFASHAVDLASPDISSKEPCVVLGYSLGARAAVAAAQQLQQQQQPSTLGMVLESYHPGCESTAERDARRERDDETIAAVREDFDGLLAGWYDQAVFASLNPEQRTELVAQKRARDPQALADVLERWSLSRCPLRGEQTLPEIPTLLVAGERDPKYAQLATQLHAQLPHSELAILPDAGHIPHLETPTRFSETVNAFLRKLL